MDALKIDPDHSEAKIMLTTLTEKAQNFKEQVIKLIHRHDISNFIFSLSNAR